MSHRESIGLRNRVRLAAEACLERNGAVGPLELLQQMRLLYPGHVEQWRKGNPHWTPLAPHIQGSPEKLRKTFEHFADWVRERGLVPIEASYLLTGHRGVEQVLVTADGDPGRERFFRTHYRSAELSEKKSQRLQAKLNKAPDIVTYILVSESATCSECQTEIDKGQLLIMERGQPLCLACADMDHLEFLPAGDATLSRRARKYSPLSAVVVRFSRARKRYERQGLLVTPEAIDRAEQECEADADKRAALREKAAVRRQADDRELVAAMTQLIAGQYPGCPADEARQIAEHTAQRGSGRVGRSAAGRALDPQALHLAVVAWIRHQHTNYDSLLMRGTERFEARAIIRDSVERVLHKWTDPT